MTTESSGGGTGALGILSPFGLVLTTIRHWWDWIADPSLPFPEPPLPMAKESARRFSSEITKDVLLSGFIKRVLRGRRVAQEIPELARPRRGSKRLERLQALISAAKEMVQVREDAGRTTFYPRFSDFHVATDAQHILESLEAAVRKASEADVEIHELAGRLERWLNAETPCSCP